MLLFWKFLSFPGVKAGLVVLAVFAVMQVRLTRAEHRHASEKMQLEAALASETNFKLVAERGWKQETSNRLGVELALSKQDAAIEGWRLAAEAIKANSSLAAIRAHAKGLAEAEALRAPTSKIPPGHASLNKCLKDLVGGVPCGA